MLDTNRRTEDAGLQLTCPCRELLAMRNLKITLTEIVTYVIQKPGAVLRRQLC